MDTDGIDAMLSAARSAMARAYAPYSNLTVGAATLWKSGKIHAGCNVENASYGLSICAERVSIANAVCSGERKLAAVCIISSLGSIIRPCGACLQVMIEFAESTEDVQIVAVSADGSYDVRSLAEYLPLGFELEGQQGSGGFAR